jgi:hypothetical protein
LKMSQQREEPLLNFIEGEVRFEPGLASTASHALASKTPGRSRCFFRDQQGRNPTVF